MGVPSKNSSVLDMGRRPELKSDEFFEGTPLSSRDNCTFVLETAQESGSVIDGATRDDKRTHGPDYRYDIRYVCPRVISVMFWDLAAHTHIVTVQLYTDAHVRATPQSHVTHNVVQRGRASTGRSLSQPSRSESGGGLMTGPM